MCAYTVRSRWQLSDVEMPRTSNDRCSHRLRLCFVEACVAMTVRHLLRHVKCPPCSFRPLVFVDSTRRGDVTAMANNSPLRHCTFATLLVLYCLTTPGKSFTHFCRGLSKLRYTRSGLYLSDFHWGSEFRLAMTDRTTIAGIEVAKLVSGV